MSSGNLPTMWSSPASAPMGSPKPPQPSLTPSGSTTSGGSLVASHGSGRSLEERRNMMRMLHMAPSVVDPTGNYVQQMAEATSMSAENASTAAHKLAEPLTIHKGAKQCLEMRIIRTLMDLTAGVQSIDRVMSVLLQQPFRLASAVEILTLCDRVVAFFMEEDSLVDTALPCRVYGDIHGQLPDLLQFFNTFSWPDKRKGDILSMNYVFLGDFVDRGSFSLEVVCLLFSLKILYPFTVWLLRGNHEDRVMNTNYGFKDECLRKLGPQEGEIVWERVNDAFEFLPVAAVIEQAVLCVHGGIGDSINSPADLRGIKKPIQVVTEVHSTTCVHDRRVLDALWSDPTENDSILGTQQSPRGLNTCRYGPDRVAEFLKLNDLKLIIRAHECVQAGYEYFAGGQLLTVFSATNYCNQYNNDGAMVVLVRDRETGSIVEHAQVVKAGLVDTSFGWAAQQYRSPTPLRACTTTAALRANNRTVLSSPPVGSCYIPQISPGGAFVPPPSVPKIPIASLSYSS
eukprot:Filipodium_phascolosomae@DN3403_c0_g1_i1.p1